MWTEGKPSLPWGVYFFKLMVLWCEPRENRVYFEGFTFFKLMVWLDLYIMLQWCPDFEHFVMRNNENFSLNFSLKYELKIVSFLYSCCTRSEKWYMMKWATEMYGKPCVRLCAYPYFFVEWLCTMTFRHILFIKSTMTRMNQWNAG